MASLQNRNGSYKLTFYHQDRRRYVTLGKITEREAEAKAAQVDYLMLRVRQGLVEIPPGVPVEEFVLADGKVKAPEKPRSLATNFAALRERYLATHGNGAIEGNSLGTIRIHLAHLARTLGDGFPLAELALGDLQRHVDARVRMKHRGRPISPETVRKELSTFRAVWNWGQRMGLVSGPFPNKGLVYPKSDEKPPFQTREEVLRRIGRGGLTKAQTAELWDSLFLTLPEIDELLAGVKESATHPWIHPLLCFAAHTGARRSELIRVQVEDVDIENGTVIIRERKRVKGQRTTRRVPLSPSLVRVLGEWLVVHPGGPHLFCHGGHVERSKKRSRTTGHQNGEGRATSLKGRLATVTEREAPPPSELTKDEVSDHLKRSLSGTKWEVVRGYHVLRHSFISNCAAKGVDQRLIEAWAGHMTAETSRRYRHLIPSTEAQAIASVFS